LANQALTKGLIKKPRRCSRCKRPHPRLEKHHRDYSKPLEIIWVCPPCHAKEDSVASPREETSDH
jgi:hypothetical protein